MRLVVGRWAIAAPAVGIWNIEESAGWGAAGSGVGGSALRGPVGVCEDNIGVLVARGGWGWGGRRCFITAPIHVFVLEAVGRSCFPFVFVVLRVPVNAVFELVDLAQLAGVLEEFFLGALGDPLLDDDVIGGFLSR